MCSGNETWIFGILGVRWNFRAARFGEGTLRCGDGASSPYFLFGTFLFRKQRKPDPGAIPTGGSPRARPYEAQGIDLDPYLELWDFLFRFHRISFLGKSRLGDPEKREKVFSSFEGFRIRRRGVSKGFLSTRRLLMSFPGDFLIRKSRLGNRGFPNRETRWIAETEGSVPERGGTQERREAVFPGGDGRSGNTVFVGAPGKGNRFSPRRRACYRNDRRPRILQGLLYKSR